MSECRVIPIVPDNYGWLQVKLHDDYINHIWDCINTTKKESYKDHLIGHIEDSQLIEDKDNKLYNGLLINLVKDYGKHWSHNHTLVPTQGPELEFYLYDFWVNYQNQHEYNPIHSHGGMYSFAGWLTIPTDFEEQAQHHTAKGANRPTNSAFTFEYTDMFGEIRTHLYALSPKWNGTLLFFPSKLRHAVYPYYNCDEQRISFSGNISLRVK